MRTKILNLTLYELGWFACVLGAATGAPSTGATIAIGLTLVHLALSVERGRELTLILAVGLIGLTLEAAHLSLRVFVFESSSAGAWLPPLWIVALWLQFATLLNFSLDWLSKRPLVAFFAGFLGGPLAFLSGERLGAVSIGEPRLSSLAILGLAWGLGLPAVLVLARALRGSAWGHYRPFVEIESPRGAVLSGRPGMATDLAHSSGNSFSRIRSVRDRQPPQPALSNTSPPLKS